MGALIQMHHAVLARMRGGGAPPGPVFTTFTDDFNRADADPMTDPPGGSWTSGPGGFDGCKIVSNALQGAIPTYCAARLLTPVFASDHKATVTIGDPTGAYIGPCVRLQSPTSASGYVLMTGGSGAVVRLYKATESGADITAGGFVQLGADIFPDPVLVSGGTLSLEAIGTTLNIYLNGVLKTSRTDATWTGGQPGVHVYGNAKSALAFGTEGMSAGGGPVTLGEMAIGTTFTIT